MAVFHHYMPDKENKSRAKGCLSMFGLILLILGTLFILLAVVRYLYENPNSINTLEQSAPADLIEESGFVIDTHPDERSFSDDEVF